jgi:hypothetical protein
VKFCDDKTRVQQLLLYIIEISHCKIPTQMIGTPSIHSVGDLKLFSYMH